MKAVFNRSGEVTRNEVWSGWGTEAPVVVVWKPGLRAESSLPSSLQRLTMIPLLEVILFEI